MFTAKGTTESGDDFCFGSWTTSPTELEVAKLAISVLEYEIEYWVIDAGYDMTWAKENPIEALEEALIYPEIVEV